MGSACLTAGDAAWRLTKADIADAPRGGIYDKDGVQLHRFKDYIAPMYPECFPYHWLVGFVVCISPLCSIQFLFSNFFFQIQALPMDDRFIATPPRTTRNRMRVVDTHLSVRTAVVYSQKADRVMDWESQGWIGGRRYGIVGV